MKVVTFFGSWLWGFQKPWQGRTTSKTRIIALILTVSLIYQGSRPYGTRKILDLVNIGDSNCLKILASRGLTSQSPSPYITEYLFEHRLHMWNEL